MKYSLLYLLLVITAIVIVTLIFAYVGVDEIINKLKEIGLTGFLCYSSSVVLGILMTVIGWHLILHSHNIKTSFLHSTIGQLIGNAISYITPSMYIGGEPVKTYYIGTLYNTSKSKVFSTVVFAKFQELASLILFIYAGTLIMILGTEEVQLPKGIWTVLLIVDIFLGLIVILALRSIIKNSPVFSNLAEWIAKKGIFRKHIEKIIPKIIKTEELIYLAFRHDWKTGIIAFVFNFTSIVIAFIKPLIFFYFLYHQNRFSLVEMAAIFTLSQILMVFQITPGCVGMFEGGQIGIFALVGIGTSDVASFLLVYRFVDLLITGSGIYLAIHYNLVKFVSAKLETADSPPDANKSNCSDNLSKNNLL